MTIDPADAPSPLDEALDAVISARDMVRLIHMGAEVWNCTEHHGAMDAIQATCDAVIDKLDAATERLYGRMG